MKKVLFACVLSGLLLSGCAAQEIAEVQTAPAVPQEIKVEKTAIPKHSGEMKPQETVQAEEENLSVQEENNIPVAEQTEALTDVFEKPVEVQATKEKTIETEMPVAPQTAEKETPAPTSTVEHTAPEEPVVVEHAKTGYDEPEEETPPPVVEPEPEPMPPADIAAAVAAAEAYAIEIYNVTIDPTLDFTNSAYRFPAVVPLTADQETLNAKAVNMVEYTFQQQIRQYGVTIEKMRETGIRCRILIQASGNDLQTYVFYA